MKAEQHDQIAEALLAAATEIIATNGFEALRVRDVAVKANVALGTPNYKFKSRRGLLLAVLERANRMFDEFLTQVWLKGQDQSAKLAALEFLWARVEFALKFPHETLIRAHAVYSNALEGFRDVIAQFADRNVERILEITQRLRNVGLIRLESEFAHSFFVRSYSFTGFSYAQSAALASISRQGIDSEILKVEVACAFEALILGNANPDQLKDQVTAEALGFLNQS